MLTGTIAVGIAVGLAPTDWSLHYERSNFLQTGRYSEALEYCRRLDAASASAKLLPIGISPQGRPLVALAVSKERSFSPEAARRSPKPLIFVLNGIHSGEIEGKDASLMLARDILIHRRHPELFEGANILIVPVFGLDAHERFGPYNRINQNGPAEMGWRSSAQNLNLNRDFIKADAGEMRALIPFLHDWRPDFLFDNHTTDGGDWQYVVMLGIPMAQTLDPALASWSRGLYETLERDISADGYLVSPYFNMEDDKDPAKGISVGDFSPRYSIGYWAAMNRPSVLVETHMLKPYKQRVDGTYATMVRAMSRCVAEATRLKAMNRAADALDAASGEGTRLVLSADTADAKRPFTFKGFPYKPYKSHISGSEIAGWDTSKPTDIPSTLRDQFRPGLTVTLPAAYAVPPQWKSVLETLALHGLRGEKLRQTIEDNFEVTRFAEVKFSQAPFESRFMPSFKTSRANERRELPAGTMVYPVSQVGAKLLAHMLEPEAPDSLLRWGFFNVIFEPKEYFEEYAMEPIAKKMLAEDPKLKAEFEERLKDEKFAKDPRARMQFFYELSPYMDKELNLYPVVRLTTAQLARARAQRR